jgi:hypothetical protein
MDQLTDPAERVDAALASIDRDLDRNRDFYILLPANIVDALLGVAKVAAHQMANPAYCGCTSCAIEMAEALEDLVEASVPI